MSLPKTLEPADLHNLVFVSVVAGGRILLGSNSGLFLLSELLLGSLAKCLHPIDCTRHPSNFCRYLATTNQTDNNTGTDDKSQDEAVFAICKINWVSNRETNTSIGAYLHHGGVQPLRAARVSTK